MVGPIIGGQSAPAIGPCSSLLTMHEITSLRLPKCNNQRAPLLIHVKGQDADSRYVELCPQIFLNEVPALIQALQAILDNQQAIAGEKSNGEKQDDGEKPGAVQFTRDREWIGRMVKLRDGTIRAITGLRECQPDYVTLDNGRGYYSNGRYYAGDCPSEVDIIEILPEGS